MPFEFKPKHKSPSEYGGKVADALRDEVKQFGSAHRKHGIRRMMGLERDMGAPEHDPEKPSALDAADCPECKEGTCDNPEHMNDGDKEALASLEISLHHKKSGGHQGHANDHDFDE